MDMIQATSTKRAGWLLAIIFAVAPVVAFIAPKGMTPLAVVCALGGLFLVRFRMALWGGWRGPTVLAIAVCLFALISSAWALDGALAARGAAKLAGNLLLGAVLIGVAAALEPADKTLARRGATIGLAIILGILFIEWGFHGVIYETIFDVKYRLAGSGPFWLNAPATIALLLAWPVAKGRRPLVMAGILTATTLILALVQFRAGIAALGAGMGVAILLLLARRVAAGALALSFAVGILMAPLVAETVFEPERVIERLGTPNKSVMHRVHIWHFTAQRVLEKPLAGWGMNASRTIPGGQDAPSDSLYETYDQNLPLHPHNATLQVWLELGLLGAIVWAALWGVGLFRLLRRLDRSSAVAVGGFAVTVFTLANISYGLWQSWWLSSLWLAVAVMITADTSEKT